MRTIPFLLACACVPAAVVSAADNLADPYVRVGVAGWYATPSITIDQAIGGAVDGDQIGLEDAKVLGMIDVYLDLPVPLLPGIHAGAWQWSETATGGGEAKSTAGYLVGMYELELIDRVGVAGGLGVMGQNLEQPDGSSNTKFIPAAAARAWVKVTDSLTGEVHVIGGALGEQRGLDVLAQISWRVFGPIAVIGGWRQTMTKQEVSNDLNEVNLGGPFLGAAFSF
jgi:hypothetical protein